LKWGQPQRHRLTLSRFAGLSLSACLVLLLWLGWALPARAVEACAPMDPRGVAQLFDQWNSALRSGDPDQVVALYSDDALLLPTLSSQPRNSPAGIRDYFKGFLAGEPQGHIDSRSIQLGCNEAMAAGTYSFRFADGHQVQARYTFVYVFNEGHWQIQHHHSSLMPSA
jgi:uncharacterized protein (TIGR02246 family)